MKLWRIFKQKRIYADAAAATPLSDNVQKELARLLGLYGNPSALHKEAQAAQRELDGARERVARTIAAHADEIIFTSGGTEANNLAIFGTLRTFLQQGEKVHAITSAIEHSSVLEPLRALVREGLELTELPVEPSGKINIKTLREAIIENTAFVSIQMVNSEIGTIQDIREIAKEIRHERSRRIDGLPIYLHTDASQAPLWLPLHIERLGVDMLTLDAQKIMGPKGAGALYVKRGVPLTPHIYGGGQERGLRSGTENVAFVGALAVALEEAQAGADANTKNISTIRDFLLSEIQKLLPGVELNGAAGEWRVANNLNIYIPNLNGDMAVVALDAEGVAASTRSACDTDDENPSHVLSALGYSSERSKSSIRLTFLPTATQSEAKSIASILLDVTKRYGQK